MDVAASQVWIPAVAGMTARTGETEGRISTYPRPPDITHTHPRLLPWPGRDERQAGGTGVGLVAGPWAPGLSVPLGEGIVLSELLEVTIPQENGQVRR